MSKGQIIIISIVGAIFIALSAVLIIGTGKENTPEVEFTPPLFDDAAEQGVPDVLENMKYSQVDVAGNYSVGLCGNAEYNNGELVLYFSSADSNRVFLRAIIIDKDGNKLGESGLIRPGEYLPSIPLTSAPAGNTVTVKVISYEFETYYSMGTAPINISFTNAE